MAQSKKIKEVDGTQLDIWELAKVCRSLKDTFGYNGDQLARRLGYNRNHINFAIHLSELPEAIWKDIQAGFRPPQKLIRILVYRTDPKHALAVYRQYKRKHGIRKLPDSEPVMVRVYHLLEAMRKREWSGKLDYALGIRNTLHWLIDSKCIYPLDGIPEKD